MAHPREQVLAYCPGEWSLQINDDGLARISHIKRDISVPSFKETSRTSLLINLAWCILKGVRFTKKPSGYK